jgi:hypothetical protein
VTVLGRASSILVLGTKRANVLIFMLFLWLFLQSKFFYSIAQVAELVDALVSGTSVRKYVKVRVLSWAQLKKPVMKIAGFFICMI